jgi:TPR repeat protein
MQTPSLIRIMLSLLVCSLFTVSGFAQAKKEEIKELLTKAEKGDAASQLDLGMKYARGEGVNRDYQEALKWCLKSAEQGNPVAQFNVGSMYDKSRPVLVIHISKKDNAEAIKWYRKAAEQGHIAAQRDLGRILADPSSPYANAVDAYAWLSIASSNGEEIAKSKLTWLELRIMSPASILEGQRRTKELQKEIEAKIASKKAAK